MDTREPSVALLGATVTDRQRAIGFMLLALARIPVIVAILALHYPSQTLRPCENLTPGRLNFLDLLPMFMSLANATAISYAWLLILSLLAVLLLGRNCVFQRSSCCA